MLYSGLSETQFAKNLGVVQKTLNNYTRGRAPSSEILTSILEIYPEISARWLMTGEGSMLKSDGYANQENEVRQHYVTSDPLLDYKPRIPYEAAAGTLSEVMGGVSQYHCEQLPIVQAFPKYDFTIIIKGNSMTPQYEGGDEVACKRVDDTSFIQWGRTHVLDTAQGVVIKRLYDAGDSFRCVSYNSDEYPDFLIHRSEVFGIFLIVGLIRM